jgi:DNA-binding protein YbaB
MNGEKQIISLKIAKDAIDPEDPEMLEDLITTAVNEAGKKADEMVQKSMSEVTGGLGLPGGMF